MASPLKVWAVRSVRTAVVATVASLSMLAVSLPEAAAAPPAAPPAAEQSAEAPETAASGVHGRSLEAQAKRLEPFLSRNADGTFAMGVSEQRAPVSPSDYRALVASMEQTNALVRSGEVLTTDALTVYPAAVAAYGMESTGNKVYYYWWGISIHLTAYWTNKLINAANTAGAVAALCAATGICAGAAAVVAAMAWLAGSIIGLCSNSRGVVIKRNHLGPVWCHGH